MKSIFVLLGCICLSSVYAAPVNDTVKRVIVETVEYSSLEQGWSYYESKWKYYNKPTNLTPVDYNLHKSIKTTTDTGRGEEMSTEKVEIKSRGYYRTREKGWDWRDQRWYCNGTAGESFPFSFIRIAVVDSCVCGSGMKKSVNVVMETKVQYRISGSGWKWNIRRRKWEKNGRKVDEQPEYGIVESIKTIISP